MCGIVRGVTLLKVHNTCYMVNYSFNTLPLTLFSHKSGLYVLYQDGNFIVEWNCLTMICQMPWNFRFTSLSVLYIFAPPLVCYAPSNGFFSGSCSKVIYLLQSMENFENNMDDKKIFLITSTFPVRLLLFPATFSWSEPPLLLQLCEMNPFS